MHSMCQYCISSHCFRGNVKSLQLELHMLFTIIILYEQEELELSFYLPLSVCVNLLVV